jgi:hypothetical protein
VNFIFKICAWLLLRLDGRFILHEWGIQLANVAFFDARLTLFFIVNLNFLITNEALALALFQAPDRYVMVSVTFCVARVKVPLLFIVSIAVTSFQPVAVIEVAAAASGFVMAAAAGLLFQEIFRAQNLLRPFVQHVRVLLGIVVRKVVVLMFVLAEFHHLTVFGPSLLSLQAIHWQVALVFFSEKFVVLGPDFTFVPFWPRERYPFNIPKKLSRLAVVWQLWESV